MGDARMSEASGDCMKWFYKFLALDLKINSKEDDWYFEEEPHTPRRKEILKKYPEIKKLMGYDPIIAVWVVIEVVIQCIMAYFIQDASWTTIFILGYFISGTLNHSLGSAIHEIGHNLAFGHSHPVANRVISLVANVPIIFPMAVTYKKYHADHHRYLGEENGDVDIPTRLESYLFRHPITKVIWLIIHPLIHSIRPFYKSPQALIKWEYINICSQVAVDLIVFNVFGIKSLCYLALGTLLGLGLHPLSGHFISEHYLFSGGQATHSYYGPLNGIMFNLGYHIEHHDFPYIPYRKLPELHKIAPEYYNNIPYHTSWVKVLWDFVFNENMGPFARGVGFKKGYEGEQIQLKSD